MKKTLLLLTIITINIFAQPDVNIKRLKSNFVKKENRVVEKVKILDRIDKLFSEKVDEKKWGKLLSDVSLIFYKNDQVYKALKKITDHHNNYSNKFLRKVLIAIFSLYPNRFVDEVESIFYSNHNSEIFVMSSIYLLMNYSKEKKEKLLPVVKEKIKQHNNIITDFFKYNFLQNNFPEPDISKLLSHYFQKGKTIVYAFFRQNRNYPGITVIKKPDGSYVKNKDGSLFYISQLGRAVSNLPGYLWDGNTPQGIFSIVGTYISPTKSIGPTPNILTRIPYEKSPQIFFHAKNKFDKWNIEDYKNLLPKSFQDFLPMYEAYYAGKRGRRLIIMHGSTDDLSFYQNEPYFPLTPTMGCISSKELWDENTGKCVESDQVILINAFNSTKMKKGFLVVINLDAQEKPVSIEEIKKLIQKN